MFGKIRWPFEHFRFLSLRAHACALALSGCQIAVQPASLEAQYMGCDEVRLGPVCLVKETGLLRFWFGHATDRVVVRLGGEELNVVVERTPDGTFAAVATPALKRRLVLRLEVEEDSGRRVFELPVEPLIRPPKLEAAWALRRSNPTGARTRLVPFLTSKDPVLKARARRLEARIRLDQGELQRGIDLLRSNMDDLEELGLISLAAVEREALADTVRRVNGDYVQARELLEGLPRFARIYPSAEAKYAYYSSQLALSYGDFRAALSFQDKALTTARRLGMVRYELDTVDMRITLLRLLGRFRETSRLIDRLEEGIPMAAGCLRADRLNNVGWHRLLLEKNLGRRKVDPRDMIREAVREYSRSCKISADLANSYRSLAEAHLHFGDLKGSREALERARAVDPKPSMLAVLEGLEIEANINQAEGRWTEAEASLARLQALSVARGDQVLRWKAEVGLGKVSRQLGRLERSLSHFKEAERLVDQSLRAVPFGEGRSAYAEAYSDSALSQIEVLLELKRTRKASETARRHRRRVMDIADWTGRVTRLSATERTAWYRALAQYRKSRAELESKAKDDWRLSNQQLRRVISERAALRRKLAKDFDLALSTFGIDQAGLAFAPLRPAGPEELILLYHPTKQGWLGFAINAAGVRTANIGNVIDASTNRSELARRLLDPFKSLIRSTRKMTVLASGPLSAIDFHTLAFDGEPLHATRPVYYGSDLSGNRAPNPQALSMNGRADRKSPQRALVVADPTGDLPMARKEGMAIARILKSGDMDVDLLVGEQATFASVQEALARPGLELFHYAGHGEFKGVDGSGAGLLLSEGGRFEITDVLSLSRAPRRVVLSACASGRVEDQATSSAGLGLAQAFLVAGAQWAVASRRDVSDKGALRLMEAAYASIEEIDLPSALRKVELNSKEQPGSMSVRIFVR